MAQKGITDNMESEIGKFLMVMNYIRCQREAYWFADGESKPNGLFGLS